MNTRTTTLVLLVACACAALADVKISASVQVTSDPYIWGTISGTMQYYYNETPGAVDHLLYYSWSLPGGYNPKEIFNFKKSIKYKLCGTHCDAETYKLPAPKFFRLASDTYVDGQAWNGCDKFSRYGDDIEALWFASERLCKVQYKATVAGKPPRVMEFSQVTSNVDMSVFTKGLENCPSPVCNRIMDIMLVLDFSGSINSDEWADEVAFAKSIVDSYTISPTATTMGIAFFDDSSRVELGLSASASTIKNHLTNYKPRDSGGWTCIGCGIREGMRPFSNPVSGRTALNPQKVMIVLTDGACNRPEGNYNQYMLDAAQDAEDAKILRIAIGVGGEIDEEQLYQISSTIAGVKTTLFASSFSELYKILEKLIAQTCTDIPSQPCGSMCYGFCYCDKVCICPTCPDDKSCVKQTCSSSTYYGCTAKNVTCTSPDKCHTSKCVEGQGCVNTDISAACNDNKACTDNKCDPLIGCMYPATKCDLINACKNNKCDLRQDNCVATDVNCTDGDKCTQDLCDGTLGCQHPPVPYTGVNDKCTLKACKPSVGWESWKVNCDDNDGCTTDSCDPLNGCVHAPVNCPKADCTVTTCVSKSNKTYECKNELIPGCAEYCKGVNCNAGADKRACHLGKCVVLPGATKYTCEYTPFINGGNADCTSGNLCIIDQCNNATETCTHTPVSCGHNVCQTESCDPKTGQCAYKDVVCQPADPCTKGWCQNDTCITAPACPAEKCLVVTCSNDNGKAKCNKVPLNCSSGSACSIDGCDAATGLCTHEVRNCDDAQPCTIDSCDTKIGCINKNDTCDDLNPCTNDTCVWGSGCAHSDKCVDGLFCTDDSCLPGGVCQFIASPSPLDLSSDEQNCYEAYCSEEKKAWKKRIIKGAFIDVCGACAKVQNGVAQNNTGDTACVTGWTSAKLAAALSAAAIAGIVIAAVVGAAIVLAGGAFGTYELVKRANAASNQAVANNPLYQAGHNDFSNPMAN